MTKMVKKRVLWMGEATFLSTGYGTYGKELLSHLYATGKYDIAELGGYARPDDKRSQSIPWKYYGTLPTTEEEARIYASKMNNQWGAQAFEPICLDFKPDIVCTPPGELVITEHGYIPIEKIRIGDKVLSHSGKFREVDNVYKRQYNGELYSVYFNGCSFPLKLTPEHPVLVYEKRKQQHNKKSIKTIYNDIKPVFKAIKDIKVGDLIVSPRLNTEPNDDCIIDISQYLSQYVEIDNIIYNKNDKRQKQHNLPKYIHCDYDFGVLLGYIISDGCIQNSGITITFNCTEQRFVEDAQLLFKKIFNVNTCVNHDNDKNATNISCHSTLLSQFLLKFIDNGVPSYIINNYCKNTIYGIIRGLVRGDGCYKLNTVSFSSTSKVLANAFRLLCRIIYIETSLQKHKIPTGVAYEVEAYGESANKLHEIVQKYTNVSGLVPSAVRRSKRVQFVNNDMVSSVRKIYKQQYYGQVYNISVTHDNSYILHQACVHNCDMRDPWMFDFQYSSPFRRLYHWAIMPTVDSAPQLENWLAMYMDADSVFSYTEFGRDVLLKETGGKINFKGIASPCPNYSVFKPVADKAAHKAKIGLDSDTLIVGTVMRNQKRKLYPDLIQSFKLMLEQFPRIADKSFLYIHTSYPDIGWDIPRLVRESGIGHKILFTYYCDSCKHSFPSFFSDAVRTCTKCGKPTARMPSGNTGVSTQQLADIMNTFDLYVQYSVCEGFGIPLIESAACGVPVLVVDYSGMASVADNLGSTKIKVERFFREAETHAYRAYPDNEDCAKKMGLALSQPENMKAKRSHDTYLKCIKHYQWQSTFDKWQKVIDECQYANWKTPPRILQPNTNIPQGLSLEDFVAWCVVNVWREPSQINSYFVLRMMRDLNYGQTIIGHGGPYYSEDSLLSDKPKYKKFGKQDLVNVMVELAQNRNYWEKRRTEL